MIDRLYDAGMALQKPARGRPPLGASRMLRDAIEAEYRAGTSYQKMADAAGVSCATVTRFVKHGNLTIDNFDRLAPLFGLRVIQQKKGGS